MDINTHNVEAVETEAYNPYLLVVFQSCIDVALVNTVVLIVAI